jgi:hypothetical protein
MEINVHAIIQSVNDYWVYKNNLSISVSIGSSLLGGARPVFDECWLAVRSLGRARKRGPIDGQARRGIKFDLVSLVSGGFHA